MNDLISRAAAVRALVSSNGDYLDAWERLEKIPAVDAIPVEWLKDKKLVLSLDGGMLINWLICEWQKEQEVQDG